MEYPLVVAIVFLVGSQIVRVVADIIATDTSDPRRAALIRWAGLGVQVVGAVIAVGAVVWNAANRTAGM